MSDQDQKAVAAAAALARALKLMAGVLAGVFAMAPPISASTWAAANLVVPDGPRRGAHFDTRLAPYLCEPLDFISSDVADNKAVVRKSKQTGFTTLALAAVGYTACVEPCDLFLIEPTDANLKDFLDLKLQRTIEGSPALGAKILPQHSRSGRGSTTYTKRFIGGSLLTAIANSASDLRGKTRQKVIRDEADEYPADLDGQGSPHDMITGAYESFLASGEWKDLSISTPVIKGESFIDAEFEKGDKRFWHVRCPQCAGEFYFEWNLKLFQFSREYPHKAFYATPCCGHPIEGYERDELVRAGRWVPTAPAPGKFRSYHFDALSSPFVPWDVIAARFIEAQGKPEKEKTFYNLTLGLAYEPKGDAPLVDTLLLRREEYEQGTIPPRGLLLVAGADVQHSGIWYEIVAYAENGESWSVLHGFLEGETDRHDAGAFAKLAELYERRFADAFEGTRQVDAMAVDAGDGGRANQVHNFTRSRPRAFSVKGMAGWTAPAIGTPSKVDVKLNGKKLPRGATLWPVGTWSLKSTFYTNLAKEGRRAGKPLDPAGYCHFHMGCDEPFFGQMTAEGIKTKQFRGRTRREWVAHGANHLLDCRVYASAMAELLGMSRMTENQWAALRQERGIPAVLAEPDMLAPDAVRIAATPVERPALIGRQQVQKRRVLSRGLRT